MPVSALDDNRNPLLTAVSNVDDDTPVRLWADPTTHALIISGTISVDTTGLATSAKQDTIIGHLDGVEALLTTIDADTSSLASTVVAGQIQVDIAAASTDITVQDGGGSLTVDNNGTFVIQENGAALTALQLIDDTVQVLGTDTYTEATSKGITIGAVRRDADTTLVNTTNEFGPLQMDANGRLKVEAFSGETLPVSLTSTTVTGTVAVTQSGTWDEVGINDSGNSITVDYATTGSGTATGALRVELPTNGTGVIATVGAVTAITNALPAGTNAIGKLAANSGVDIGDTDVISVVPGTGATNLGKAEDAAHTTGDTGVMMLGVRSASPTDRSAGPTDGDYEPFALNEVGAIWVSETSSINGGDSTATASTADGSTALTNSAQVIKASAGKLTGYYIYNPNSSATYVNFYNTAAASVTVGTTNPLFNICIPATSAANLSGLKVTFGTAMSWSATTTGGGNTAPSTALEATCWYK